MTEVERATIQRLMDENAALRRRGQELETDTAALRRRGQELETDTAALRRQIYELQFDVETARQMVTNASLEGQGVYVFSEDGEGNKFDSQHKAWLHQLKLQEEGMTSVRVLVQERMQGVEQSEPYECPQRPSHDPQDVRHAA